MWTYPHPIGYYAVRHALYVRPALMRPRLSRQQLLKVGAQETSYLYRYGGGKPYSVSLCPALSLPSSLLIPLPYR